MFVKRNRFLILLLYTYFSLCWTFLISNVCITPDKKKTDFSFSSWKQLRLPNVKMLVAAPRVCHCEIITRIQLGFISENRSSPSLKFQCLFKAIICCLLAASLSLKLLSADLSLQNLQSFLSRTAFFFTFCSLTLFLPTSCQKNLIAKCPQTDPVALSSPC